MAIFRWNFWGHRKNPQKKSTQMAKYRISELVSELDLEPPIRSIRRFTDFSLRNRGDSLRKGKSSDVDDLHVFWEFPENRDFARPQAPGIWLRLT